MDGGDIWHAVERARWAIADLHAKAAGCLRGPHAVLVGGVIADENRCSVHKGRMGQKRGYGRPFVEPRPFGLNDHLAVDEMKGWQIGCEARHRGFHLGLPRRIGAIVNREACALVFHADATGEAVPGT